MSATRPIAPSAAPLAALWSPRALIGCVLFGEGLAAVLSLGADRPSWVFFGLASLTVQWIVLLTLGALYVLRGRLAAARTGGIAAIAFALLMASCTAVLALAAATLPPLGERVAGGWPGLAARTLAIVAMVGGLAIAAFRGQWEARQLALRAKQAELDVLHARIRPHFLFNTLNTATALVHSHPHDAERVLLDLSDLFRAALGKTSVIPLSDELDLTRRYLEIESARFGSRLRIDWAVPAGLPAAAVPPLSIQPLAENAVRHGIERRVEGGTVAVRAAVIKGNIVIEITNPAPPPDAAASAGHGVGLRASIARIEAATGGRGGVALDQRDGTFVTRVDLPVDGA